MPHTPKYKIFSVESRVYLVSGLKLGEITWNRVHTDGFTVVYFNVYDTKYL